MRSLHALLLIGAMLLTGCDSVVFISAGFHPSDPFVTVSGFVSIIQVTTIISSGGTTTLVTSVTFLQTGTASTINFCGDLGNQFVVNTFTSVNFTQGQNCSTIIAVSTDPANSTAFAGQHVEVQSTTTLP